MNESKVFIIAEAGVNHNGSVELAQKMIDVAIQADADAVKFQTFKTANLVSLDAPKAEYQIENTGNNSSQYEMISKLELSEESHVRLKDYCLEKGIEFLSSPFDLWSVDFLHQLGVRIFKIPSGEITNLPYLRKVGSFGKPVILSSGMSDLNEIEDAVNVIVKAGTKRDLITVLHCNTDYPTDFKDVNLLAMKTIREEIGVKTGYSDHTSGIEVAVAAVALGAVVIEKHFTLDKSMQGPDHRASLDPQELTNLVSSIRNVENSLGTGKKIPTESERRNIEIVRKSLVARKKILCGEAFSTENIGAKRPGNGLSPMKFDEVLGMIAKRDFEIDERIEL